MPKIDKNSGAKDQYFAMQRLLVGDRHGTKPIVISPGSDCLEARARVLPNLGLRLQLAFAAPSRDHRHTAFTLPSLPFT